MSIIYIASDPITTPTFCLWHSSLLSVLQAMRNLWWYLRLNGTPYISRTLAWGMTSNMSGHWGEGRGGEVKGKMYDDLRTLPTCIH